MNNIKLSKTTEEDLNALFIFQLEPEANFMAAFTPKNPNDSDAYFEKWKRVLNDPNNNMWTIKRDEQIVGSVLKFVMGGNNEISYWIDKKFWGQGIATAAVKIFLNTQEVSPIWGHTAFDNLGSQRVLEKCGFVKIGTDKGFANARQAEIEEFIYKLT
jgi:RimJ/RimL family protein N-acetyltransferase